MTDQVDAQLEDLHAQYTHAVNTAVSADREALAEELSREYRAHALRLTGQAVGTVQAPARRSRLRRSVGALEARLRGPRGRS